jgi:RNA polymerase sigma-70 factor, ECF subfamily
MLEQMGAIREQRPVNDKIDGRVIAACQQGDRDAMRSLFEAYKDQVFSIALYSLGDETAAGDVTQQIFLKLMTSIRQFRGDSAFSTWLYRLVINSCHDERRKQSRFVPLADSESMTKPGNRRSQETHYAQKELTESVRAAIGSLKPKMRQPVLLKYIEGFSYEEIAEVLGCSKGTVASRLNRAHKALAKSLGHLRGQVGE